MPYSITALIGLYSSIHTVIAIAFRLQMHCTQRALARRCERSLGLSRQQRSRGRSNGRATVNLQAVAAAVPHGGQHQTELASTVGAQDGPLDHGLEAFKSLIAERRFFCTQCGKCCTGVNGRTIPVPAPHKLQTCHYPH